MKLYRSELEAKVEALKFKTKDWRNIMQTLYRLGAGKKICIQKAESNTKYKDI